MNIMDTQKGQKKYEGLPDAEKQICEQRESWLATRLNELQTEEVDRVDAQGKPTGTKIKAQRVTVVRGSLDDVIGVQVEY